MKTILIVLLFLNTCYSNNPDKQVRIPLNNKEGVPYSKVQDDFNISGFEIDKNGFLYFFDGETPTLVCYNNETLVFRKQINFSSNNQLYIYNDTLIVFDNKFNSNNLFSINKDNGQLINSTKSIITNIINSFVFNNQYLIAEVFDYQERIDISTELCFVEFSFSGEIIGQKENRYGLAPIFYPDDYELMAIEFIGKWNDFFVYNEYDYMNEGYKIILMDNEAKIVSSTNIKFNRVGESFYGNPPEHRKLRNDKLYFLGRDGTDALITEIALDDLFQIEEGDTLLNKVKTE